MTGSPALQSLPPENSNKVVQPAINKKSSFSFHSMKQLLFALLIYFSTYGNSISDIYFGSQFTLAVPTTYIKGFIGRAFLMETNQPVPKFKTALTIEAIDEKYACSLDVFLGDFKVWSSGHFSRFYTMEICMLYLTQHGDLQLKGHKDRVGWRTGTSRQGVKRLSLLNNGNLVLVNEQNVIAWQSFNFPTNVMLWGQRLDVETRLTSFPTNSTSFYSFEIQRDKIALYLNSGKWKHSYWELKPSNNRNITFIRLASKRLEILNDFNQKIAQIHSSERNEPLRFLALGNKTGNLGLYYFSPDTGKFEVSFRALNSTCDLPLACKPYGICTFSNVCSCIRLVTRGDRFNSDCSEDLPENFCGKVQVEMLELQGVSNVLRDNSEKVNISKEECAGLCVVDCKCVAALYTNLRECFLYGEVRGVKQVDRESGVSYMVKVIKGSGGSKGKSGTGLKTWLLVVIGVADGLIVVIVLGGVGYYVLRKRKNNLSAETRNNS